MVNPPCLGCEFRSLQCHNASACKKWADYQEAVAKEQAVIGPAREKEQLMLQYVKNRKSDRRRNKLSV